MTRADIQLSHDVIPAADTLRVASLNLLNQHQHLDIRLENLVGEINDLDIDVLCLQEVLATAADPIIPYLLAHTAFKYSHIGTLKQKTNGDAYGNVTLTKTKITKKVNEPFHVIFKQDFSIIPATISVTNVNGHEIHLINVHLTWGSNAAPIRMQQAEILNMYTRSILRENPDAIFIMAGDFNTGEDSAVLRFLYGLQSSDRGYGTLWVDAWKMWGTEANWITSDPETFWGAHTGARKSGLYHLDLVPKRRIDHILVHGWCYGKAGSPLTFQRFADTLTGDEQEISDHFGVLSDIYLPKANA